MATSCGVICGGCDVQHISKCAEYWCPECDEGLCSECYRYHTISKASRTHECIPVDQYNKLPSSISEIVHHCKDHGIKYTNFCAHHDTLCCPVCISTTHGECKGFLPIQEIIKTAKTSTLLENMEQNLTDIERNIEKAIQNREHNLSDIRLQRQKFHDDIKKLRDKINSKLDTLERNAITELNEAKRKIEMKIESLIDHLTNERKSVNALKMNIKALKEYASDLQTFLGSKTYQQEVEKTEKYMRSLFEDGSLENMNLKCSIVDNILDTLGTLSFGSVSIETGPSSLVLKIEKDKQAQIMAVMPQPPQKSTVNIKLSLLGKYNLPEPGVHGYRGCIIHSNGKLIITRYAKSKIFVLNNDSTVDKEIICSSFVNDLTTIDYKTVAVSSLNGVDIINIYSKQTEKVIATDTVNWCYGITYHTGTLLWCQRTKGIQRMDLSDGSITTLVKQNDMPSDCYITTYREKIYQTNCQYDTVTCYTIEGKRLWEYKNESILKYPAGITVENNGNVYVASFNSHGVVLITADGKEGRQLLTQTDGLEDPFGIFYEKSKNNLLIENMYGPAFLYHVSCESIPQSD